MRIASPSFGPQDQRLEPGLAKRDERRHRLPAELDLASTDQRQREVRQRREVARRADGPLRRHHRVDPRPEEVQEPLGNDRARPGEPEREGVRPEQEHRPDDLARQRLADARRVAHEQVLLQPVGVAPVDRAIGEEPNPVVTPYTTSPSSTSRSTTAREASMRVFAAGSRTAPAPWRATASTSATVRSAPVSTTGSVTAGRIVGYLPPMLAFIDQIVIPFLNHLYGAVGYAGVAVAMGIESAMIPLPSELVLPYAGFLISDPTQLEPITRARWDFWIVVIVATLGNTVGSLIGYAIGAWGGRPFLERWGRYLLIRPHELELADRFFQKYGPATAFFSRLLPIVRTFISFPAGVARMPLGKFILYSTLGAIPWSIVLVFAGIQLGGNWVEIRHALQPFDLAIAVIAVLLVALFIWWRLGMPGRPRRTGELPPG